MRRAIRWSAAIAAVAGILAPAAWAQHPAAHGQFLKPAGVGNTAKSSNWFGYNQGALEQGVRLFHSISGNWTVPTASQHRKGQAEYSSDWIGIGGGCVDPRCDIGDETLIQTGTEQDVSSGGKASYSAWWEVIPGPAVTIQSLRVRPGDRMHAAIREVAPAVWKISIKDLTRAESYSTTVPYTSTEDTAEWIEETPLIIGSGAGFAALPNLTSPAFDHAKTNGNSAHLKATERIELINSQGKVIGTPSSPDPDRDGFNACAWASTCPAPSSS